MIEDDPDIVFITMGLNDNLSFDTRAPGIYFTEVPGASHWIEGHPEWMVSDGLHPNDSGYAEMAVRMNEELAGLGL
ncbi:MAG: hypothetical protein H7226_01595 [Salinibacterium sp.]|nr:hypothetical protein [Salinibacterium sp.]